MIAASGRFDLPFTCTDSTGAPVAPTGTPTGTLVKNGTDLGTTVTVTMSTAQGVASCTIPSDAVNGDRFYIRISAVISAVTYVLSGPVSTISNSVAQTGDSFARIGSAGAGLTSLGDTRVANLDAAVSTRATPTNITAGTITTVTNLTNAPTTGDLTATMKASVTAAVPSVTAIRTELDTNSTQLAAILSAILATNNLSSLANIYGPGVMEIPASGSRVFKFTLAIKDAEGKAVNLDSLPTITVTNESGTSRAAGLSSVTAVTTGKYTFTYTQSSSATSEQLTFESAGTVSGEARPAYWVAVVADYDSTSMLVAIDAALALVKAKTDNLPGSPAAVGSAMTLTGAYDAAKTAASQASVDTLPTAAESATAVWSAGTRTLTSSGSGSVEVLSFDDAALDQLRGVEFIGPQAVYGEAKQIVAGDDYSGSRAIVFASDAIPDLSAASSITFSVRATDRAHTLAFSTTSVAYTTGQLAVTLTAAQTRIDPGFYDYDIEAVVGGLKQTVIGPKARLVVLEDQTR